MNEREAAFKATKEYALGEILLQRDAAGNRIRMFPSMPPTRGQVVEVLRQELAIVDSGRSSLEGLCAAQNHINALARLLVHL